MHHRVLVALACAVSVIVIAAGEAAACATAPPAGQEVQIADEEAIILWDPATRTEHFIRRAQFRSTARAFGFLVPTPTTPQLGEIADGVFASMADRIKPEVRYERETDVKLTSLMFEACNAMTAGELKSGDAIPAMAGAVRVLATAHVAGFDATTVEADAAGALGAWLAQHGFAVTPALTAWLEHYVAQQWKLTAFVVATGEEAGEAGAQARYDVATRAVRMSFQTDRPFYPYREPAADVARAASEPPPEGRVLRVHFLSTERYAATLAGAPWSARVLFAAPIEPVPELAGLGDHLRTATTFVDAESPRRGIDEIYFAPSPDRAEVRQPPIVITEPNHILIPVDLLGLGLIIAVLVMRSRRARAALLPPRATARPGPRRPGPP